MYELFQKLLDERNLKTADVCRGTNLPSSLFSEWKKGKSEPKKDKIQKICTYFDIPITYFYRESSIQYSSPYAIFCSLLEKYNVTPYQVAKVTNIPGSTFTDWKNGRSAPKQDKLKKIADYFGVYLDYLMTGREESKEKKNPYSDLKGIYLAYAKEAQDSGITPEELRLAIDIIKKIKGGM